jgi:hypothetical protein
MSAPAREARLGCFRQGEATTENKDAVELGENSEMVDPNPSCGYAFA